MIGLKKKKKLLIALSLGKHVDYSIVYFPKTENDILKQEIWYIAANVRAIIIPFPNKSGFSSEENEPL